MTRGLLTSLPNPREALRSGCARLAQLDRAPDYESGGQAFESLTARHFFYTDFSVSYFSRVGAMGEWLKPRPC